MKSLTLREAEITRLLDKRIERFGVSKGIGISLRKMGHVRLKRNNVPDWMLEECFISEIDDLENELIEADIMKKNQGIAAYKWDAETITIFFVARIHGVLMM